MKHKIELHLQPQSRPFSGTPLTAELEPERIMCNDIVLPFERHPYNMRLWVIGNEFGAMGAVWASHEQDALDELVDSDLAGGILIDEETQKTATEEEQEEWTRLGNAGEPADMDHCWMAPVEWDLKRDCALLCLFAEARGGNADNLDDGQLSTNYVTKVTP